MMPRLDRIASLYVASPLVRLRAEKNKRAIPILMYHSISGDDERGRSAYYRTNTSAAIFHQQMEYLHRSGYQACGLMRAITDIQAPIKCDRKPVVITFDDGFRDFYLDAAPILQRFDFTATMFLPTAFIGKTSAQFKGRSCLTWPEVRELQAAGIDFGSHTVSHPQLRALPRQEMEREIRESKEAIEQETGAGVESFAYPYAFPQTDRAFRHAYRACLEEAGYRGGVCTTVGRAGETSDRFCLERLPMNGLDDEALLRAKLIGAYDWVGEIQGIFKTAKGLVRGEQSKIASA